MRVDQFERMQSLSEKLAEVFLEEADPDTWPGAGMTTEDWRELELADRKGAQQIRGDRYWSKKNAAATIMLIQRIQNLTDAIRLRQPPDPDEPGALTETEQEIDVDTEIRRFEREAAALLDKVQRETRKAKFDAKTHGKQPKA